MASPTATQRPPPAWSGPVGFADTNSRLIRRPASASPRPYPSPAATTSRSTSWSQPGVQEEVEEPGARDLDPVEVRRRRRLDRRRQHLARSRAAPLPTSLASWSATGDAQSPCCLSGSPGVSAMPPAGSGNPAAFERGAQAGFDVVTNHKWASERAAGRSTWWRIVLPALRARPGCSRRSAVRRTTRRCAAVRPRGRRHTGSRGRARAADGSACAWRTSPARGRP